MQRARVVPYGRRGLRTAIAVVALTTVAGGGLNYFGYCWRKGKVLTPESKIQVAIAHVLASYPPVLETFRSTGLGTGVVSYRRPQRPIAYLNAAEFRRINPDCCAVVMRGREGWTPSFLHRVTGSVSTLIRVKYQVRYQGDDGAVLAAAHETFVPVSNCNTSQNL